MAISKSFGQSPRRKVFVRIQEVNGAKVLSTTSMSVWGHSLEDVAETVGAALDEKFGEEETDDEKDDEEEEESVTRPTIKKKARHGR